MPLLLNPLTVFRRSSGLFDFVRQNVLLNPKFTWVAGDLATPTLDFYFRSRQQDFSNYSEIDTHQLPPDNHPLWSESQSQLILVREVPLGFLKKLLRSPHRPKRIIWFIDDDIPSVGTDASLPKAYRQKISSWYKSASPLLAKLCDQVWVSTPYLAKKYQLRDEWVLQPKQLRNPEVRMIRCFYHGGSSHTQEWIFVEKLVAAIQATYSHTTFELVGNHQLNKQFRLIPRVTILHPMRWDNYQALLASREMDIGLAPLFDTVFNRGRSHTKMLDIQRQGAIGIYSERISHAELIKTYKAGFVVDDAIESWLSAFDCALRADRSRFFENSTHLINFLD